MDGEEETPDQAWSSLKCKGRWGEEKELTKEIEKGKADKVDEKQEWGATEAREGSKSARRKMIRAWLCLLMTWLIRCWRVETLRHLCPVAAPVQEWAFVSQLHSHAQFTPPLLPTKCRYLCQSWWWYLYYSSYGIFLFYFKQQWRALH